MQRFCLKTAFLLLKVLIAMHIQSCTLRNFLLRHPYVYDFAMDTSYDIASIVQTVQYNDGSEGVSEFCNCECGISGKCT